jgi:hypothetical protein
MTADEAGAAGNQEFHSLMFPPRRQDAKSFFGPLRPSPAHPIQSLRDGLAFRFRGGIYQKWPA